MIHHVTIRVAELARARRFYEAALAPLGYKVLIEYGTFLGFGEPGRPDLWIAEYAERTPMHVALAAPDEATVRAFYEAALANGGRDNGPPGPRPHYHASYYGGFVLDPDDNNIEAVVQPRG